jgi:hypothetical protein
VPGSVAGDWLQTSPISPFAPDQAEFGSASVTASISSCEDAIVTFWNCVPPPQPRSQPLPGPKSGTTP